MCFFRSIRVKKNIIVFLEKFIRLQEYKYLRIVYAIALIFSFILLIFVIKEVPDSWSYYSAKDVIMSGHLDYLRMPLYPILLIITKHIYVTIAVQLLVFYVSIAYLYKTLIELKISTRLVFLIMIIYACHPVFMYYQVQLIPESLCISLSSIFSYYLIAFIKTKRISYCWIFHALILCLFLLKPGCIFLIAVPVMLVFYLFFAKRKLVLSCFIPLLLVIVTISGYGFAMKQTYGAFTFSSVSDINLYWMLRKTNKIDLNSVKNEELKSFIADKIELEYEAQFWLCFDEASTIIDKHGLKSLRDIVQGSLDSNYKSFLFDGHNLKIVKENLFGFTGRSIDYFGFNESSSKLDFTDFFPYINFYILFFILIFYTFLIVKQVYMFKNVPVISILFLLYIAANLIIIILSAPNNYGRLIVPSVSIILIVVAQCVEWFVLFIQNNEKQQILS